MKKKYGIRLSDEELRIIRTYQKIAKDGKKFQNLVSGLISIIKEAYPGIETLDPIDPLGDREALERVLFSGSAEARGVLARLVPAPSPKQGFSQDRRQVKKGRLEVPDAVPPDTSSGYEEVLGKP